MAYGRHPLGYRLPERVRLGPVRLQVSDLSRSLDYYREVLGLDVCTTGASEAPHRVVLGGADATALVVLEERKGGRRPQRGERLGLYHFALLLPDRADLGAFVAHVAGLGLPVASADHDVSEAVYLWDPDGLGIEVYADRPRERWRARNDELFMTTARLDLQSLMEASAEWRGMPRGSVVGHVHLHVGDLQEAQRFYHDTVGLDLIVWSYPGALFLSGGGYHHHLGVNTWAAGATPRSSEEPGLLSWQIVLPTREDVQQLAEHASQVGMMTSWRGPSLELLDPWGTALHIAPGDGPGASD